MLAILTWSPACRGCRCALWNTGKRWHHPHPRISAFFSASYPAPPGDCNFACTFDNDFCDWVLADYSSIEWIRHKGPTPTQNTGPSSDHTTGGRNSNQYTVVLQAEACPWQDGNKPLGSANTGPAFPVLDPEPFVAVSHRARASLENTVHRWTQGWAGLWLEKDLCLLFPPFACLELQQGLLAGLCLGCPWLLGLDLVVWCVTVWLTLCFRRLLHLPARERCPPRLCG